MKIILDERETALYSTCISIISCNVTQKPIAMLQHSTNKKEKETIIEKEVLNLGDIVIKKDDTILLIIERKSLLDLLASIKDGRYEEQSYRLQHASGIPSHNIIYILEGMFSSLKSPQEKKMILSAMTSLSFFKGFSVIRTVSVTETAEFIVNMTDKIERDLKKGKIPAFSRISQKKKLLELEKLEKKLEEVEEELEKLEKKLDEEVEEENAEEKLEEVEEELEKLEKKLENTEVEEENAEVDQNQNQNPTKKYCEVVKKVKKENITKENMGEIILCQIPGISSITAIAIMKYVDNSLLKLFDILKTSPEELLQNIKLGEEGGKQRKINKKNVENMRHFLLDL
jgi:ERCC4-type nuclease